MAGSLSDYGENFSLDAVVGAGITKPTNLHFALFTARGTDPQSDAGTNFTEVSGGSYARVQVTNNGTNFPAASDGSKSNGTVITFATASASWGTVIAVGMYDAATSGNLIWWSDLTANKTVASGDAASFAVGAFVISLT